MIETVWELISTDRQITLRMMEEEFAISNSQSRKTKICARSLPHCLTDTQKDLRLQACQQFIQLVDDGRSLFDSVVTSDEIWCFQYDNPEQKHKAWNDACQVLQDTHNLFQKSNIKMMLVKFSDNHGVIHKAFLLPG
jgi:hypothetical protein